MPSSHLLLPPIPPSIRVYSNESTLHMRWPNYWSFSFSIIPSKEHPVKVPPNPEMPCFTNPRALQSIALVFMSVHRFYGREYLCERKIFCLIYATISVLYLGFHFQLFLYLCNFLAFCKMGNMEGKHKLRRSVYLSPVT